MREIERQIVSLLVADCLTAGYAVGVYDGEEHTLRASRDFAEVWAALDTTDEDYLILRKGDADGWIRLIYGNECDVISDYTTSIDEGVMKRASELAERFDDPTASRAYWTALVQEGFAP